MNYTESYKSLRDNQRVLIIAGLAHFIVFVILAVVSLADGQQILGINRWIKPMKFLISGGIFLWTVAIYLYYLRGYEKSSRLIAAGTAGVMTGENVLIVAQAWRGTTSHFNLATPLDGAIFAVMGLMILVNTILVVYLTYLYFRADVDLPNALIWGLRLGLVVFLFGSIQGGYMSGQTGHAVGLPDGGAGLPLVNWSVEAGDLRVAHFVGLHALQAIPLFALLAVILKKRFAPLRPTALTIFFAALYFASFTLVFVQALRGEPLLGGEIIVTKKPS